MDINKSPFFPKSLLEKKESGESKESLSKASNSSEVNISNMKPEEKHANINSSEKETKDKTEEEMRKKIEFRLKDLNLSEIKEFYPKNFKIFPKSK